MHRPFVAAFLALALGATAAAPARAASGTGPGGYTWKDCDEPDGPPCTYTITATSDGLTGLCSEEIYDDPADGLGFAFPFYGTNFADYAVSANGVVYLDNAPACCDDTNAALSGGEARPFVAVLWDDWAMDNDDELGFFCANPGCSNSGPVTFVESFQRGSGVELGVRYKEFEWFSTAHHRPTCTEDLGQQATFGLRLYEDGRILFQYQDTDLGLPAVDHGASATIGISSGFGGNHTQVSFDTAAIPRNPYAILFEPPCPELTCDRIRVDRDPVCEGTPQAFTLDTTGGAGLVTVTWDFDADGLPDATGNPVAHLFGVGTWTVTATATDECAMGVQTCSLPIDVTVHPLPVPVVTPLGDTTFCARDGESVTLDGGAFDTHQWQRNGVDIGGETMATHVATVTGSYTVVVTDANGCTAVSAPVMVDADDCVTACQPLTCLQVNVSPNPACPGEQQTLTASFAGGEGAVTVEWDLDGDGMGDVPGNPLRTVLPEGTNAVTAVITDSCMDPAPQTCTLDAEATVNPTPVPDVTALDPTSFCALDGESVTLQAEGGFATYQWERDGAPLPGETMDSLSTDVSGSHVVRVTDAAGCEGLSAPVVVNADDCGSSCTVLSCGLVTVSPNPTCEGTEQAFMLDVTGGEGAVTVEWDLDGDTLPDVGGNPVVQALPAGAVTVTAFATDSCTDPVPQTCSASLPVDVWVGAGVLDEVSPPGALPLLVMPQDAGLVVEREPDALAYSAYVDTLGSWYAPTLATGTACTRDTWVDNGDGTLTLDVGLPGDSWVVVTAMNRCGEGTAGADSRGGDRLSLGAWEACPLP